MSNLVSRLFAVEISHNDTGEKPQNSFYQSNSYKIGNYTVSSFFIVYIKFFFFLMENLPSFYSWPVKNAIFIF